MKSSFRVVLSLVLGLHSLGAAAFSELILYPNERQFVNAPTWVTCSASPAPIESSLQLCDCKYSGSILGQALGTSGAEVAAQCAQIYQHATPMGCQKLKLKITDQVLCDCKYSGSVLGQAFGRSGTDIAAQCRAQYQHATPMGCQKMEMATDEQVVCDCMYSGSVLGQAFGMTAKEVHEQCESIYQHSTPRNCRAQ